MSSRKRIEELEKLVADTTDLSALLKAASELQRLGEGVAAAKLYERVASIYERDGFILKAVAMLKQAMKLDAKRSDGMLKLIDLHLQLGLDTEAAEQSRVALWKLESPSDRERLLTALTRLTASCPTNGHLRLDRANALLWFSRLDEAKAELEEASRRLRAEHPDLSEQLATIRLPDDLTALRQVRADLEQRLDAFRLAELMKDATPN